MASTEVFADENLITEVLRQLSQADMFRAACCCGVWRRAARSNAIWQPFVQQRFPEARELVGVRDYRALYARLMRSDPDEHSRHQTSLDDYQFLVRISFDGRPVHTTSFHGKDAAVTVLQVPRRWYNLTNGEYGWLDEQEDGGGSLQQRNEIKGPQWLMDFDLDWLVEEMHQIYGQSYDPRLEFAGDGDADAKALVDYVNEYRSGIKADFDRWYKLTIEVSAFRTTDQKIATIVRGELNDTYDGIIFTSMISERDGGHRRWAAGYEDPSKDEVAFNAILNPMRDPADPTRVRWTFELELQCTMFALSGSGSNNANQEEDEEDEEEEEEDSDDEDGDSELRILGRPQFLRQLERLHWI